MKNYMGANLEYNLNSMLYDSLLSAGMVDKESLKPFFNKNNIKIRHVGQFHHYMNLAKYELVKSLNQDFYRKHRTYNNFFELAQKIYESSIIKGYSITYFNIGIPVFSARGMFSNGYIVGCCSSNKVTVSSIFPYVIEEFIRKNHSVWYDDITDTYNFKNRFILVCYNERTDKWILDIGEYILDDYSAKTISKERNCTFFFDLTRNIKIYI